MNKVCSKLQQYSDWNGRWGREIFIFQQQRPNTHTRYMQMPILFPEQRVSFTRGTFSSISSSGPSRRYSSPRTAKTTASAATGKKVIDAANCGHRVLTRATAWVDENIPSITLTRGEQQQNWPQSSQRRRCWGVTSCRMSCCCGVGVSYSYAAVLYKVYVGLIWLAYWIGNQSFFDGLVRLKTKSEKRWIESAFFQLHNNVFFCLLSETSLSNIFFRLHKNWRNIYRRCCWWCIVVVVCCFRHIESLTCVFYLVLHLSTSSVHPVSV